MGGGWVGAKRDTTTYFSKYFGKTAIYKLQILLFTVRRHPNRPALSWEDHSRGPFQLYKVRQTDTQCFWEKGAVSPLFKLKESWLSLPRFAGKILPYLLETKYLRPYLFLLILGFTFFENFWTLWQIRGGNRLRALFSPLCIQKTTLQDQNSVRGSRAQHFWALRVACLQPHHRAVSAITIRKNENYLPTCIARLWLFSLPLTDAPWPTPGLRWVRSELACRVPRPPGVWAFRQPEQPCPCAT